MQLNFADEPAAQDMINIIMRDKKVSAADAVLFAINEKNYRSIVMTGWASIALSMWGHSEPERVWDTLENPVIEVELDEKKKELLDRIMKIEKIKTEIIAVEYFLIFAMDSLGYHI